MFGYIKRHWRGENSLAWAYWVNGSVIGAIASGAVTMLDEKTSLFESALASLFGYLGLFAVAVWGLVGIWRSAKAYIAEREADPERSAFWGYTANLMVGLGALGWFVNLSTGIPDYFLLMEIEDSDLVTQFDVHADDTVIFLTGNINGGAVKAVRQAFAEDDNRTVLQIDSPGGLLDATFELADFVRHRKIGVLATNQCESGCLLVLAAAGRSMVTPEVVLGFHHPESTADFKSREMLNAGDRADEEYYARFHSYGVPKDKLASFRKRGTVLLTIGEAYAINIVDVIWDLDSGKTVTARTLCARIDCFTTPVVMPAE